MESFKIGDTVKILGRTLKNKIGKIHSVHEYKKNRFVYLVEIEDEKLITRYHWHLKREEDRNSEEEKK